MKKLKIMYPPISRRIRKLHIPISKYFGSTYEGNQCRKILKNVSRLKIPPHLAEFKDVLIALRKLNSLCNSEYLPANFQKVIDKFSETWYALVDFCGISTPPKVHIILDHLCDYFEDAEMTLIKVTDELGKV